MSRSGQVPTAFRFRGVLTAEQGGSYHQHPFSVPSGTGAIHIRFQYSPYRAGRYHNLLTLGLFDPAGFRGEAHRCSATQEVTVSQTRATPGFVPGPISPGRWTAQITAHAVLRDAVPCAYTLTIEVLPAVEPVASANWHPPHLRIARPRPGWYRGELHTHTNHSDGSWSVAELVIQAQRLGLDFISITDHNTTSAWGEVDSTASNGLLVIPGMELTTFYGHALALGVDRWVDWRVGWKGWSIANAAVATRAAGGLFVIAHPNRIGAPLCTGCRWEYDELDMRLVDGIEVWSGPWPREEDNNPANLRLWERIHMQGCHPTALADCDAHSPNDWETEVPFTYVYAKALSTSALLQGIRQGRVVLSSGPWLCLRATADARENQAGVGETLVTSAEDVRLQASWKGVPGGARLRWRQRGLLLSEQPVSDCGQADLAVEAAPDSRFWVELRAANGLLLALTNPVVVERKVRTI